MAAFNGWTVSYASNAASTDASSPARITACMTMASIGNGMCAYAVDTTALTSGTISLSATTTDIAGHTTTQTVSIRVDNNGPTIALGTPSSDKGAIVLGATVTDSPAGVASVVHSYEVIATDRAGYTATSSDMFSLNNPTDYYAAVVAFAPLGIFVLFLVALILGLLMLRRRMGSREGGSRAPPKPEPKKTDEEL